jgi:N6-L-threonylcarbamoyladenine synthase
MIVGIECTAHTFGVAVVDKGKILSNIRDMFTTDKGGIVPTEASEHHKDVSEKLWDTALKEAGISEEDIEKIAISNSPGLAPCLYAGMDFAKSKAKSLGVDLIGVNHCIAHLEIGRSLGCKDPVLLYASGANTQIIAFTEGKYRVFGETLDLGVGNFLDKIGRYFDLGFPGGPKLEKLALKVLEEDYIELPYSIKGMDVSFSGIQTKVQQLYDESDDKKIKEKLAFSIQETGFAMLVEAAERALAHTGKNELVLGGGVACNSRLQEMCKIMCSERGAKYYCPSKDLLVDNAAMIAFTGELMLKAKDLKKEIEVKPRERTDDVEVFWR